MLRATREGPAFGGADAQPRIHAQQRGHVAAAADGGGSTVVDHTHPQPLRRRPRHTLGPLGLPNLLSPPPASNGGLAAAYPIGLEVQHPESPNRWLILIRWLLAIPHYIALAVLGLIALVATVWLVIAVLSPAATRRGVVDYLVGVGRWNARVAAYVFLLVDDCPPFSLAASVIVDLPFSFPTVRGRMGSPSDRPRGVGAGRSRRSARISISCSIFGPTTSSWRRSP